MGKNHEVTGIHGLAYIVSYHHCLERSPEIIIVAHLLIYNPEWIGLPGQFRMGMGNKIGSQRMNFL